MVDRSSDIAGLAFIGAASTIGALLGALVYKVGDVPLTLSTSSGALISGLSFGWLRSRKNGTAANRQLCPAVYD